MKRMLGLTAAILVALLLAGAFAVSRALAPASDQAREIPVEIAEGSTLARIATQLEERGVVRRAWAFEWLARSEGQAAALRAGEYLLSPDRTPGQILEQLAAGRVRTHALAIPEGLTIREIAERVERAGFGDAESFAGLAHDADVVAESGVEGDSLEGYLFPETYRFARGVSQRAIVDDMVAEYRRAWAPLAAQAAARGMSDREALILASIVEKETGAPEERPLISGVFHNRLARGMRLETDPTVIYGIPDFDGNLRRRHLEDGANPYNTYRIAALPPGPIANPGEAALRAAVEPAETDALFFVSKNDGTHHFSKTYAEHARAVDRFQRRRGRRTQSSEGTP